jgi:hypothetical protein
MGFSTSRASSEYRNTMSKKVPDSAFLLVGKPIPDYDGFTLRTLIVAELETPAVELNDQVRDRPFCAQYFRREHDSPRADELAEDR